MVNSLKYAFAKNISKLSSFLLKILPTGGKSFPGLLFLSIGGKEALYDLSKKQVENGSVLITGTNGKTTTTTMLIKLLSKDYSLSSSVGNNTIYALTSALLTKKSEFGVFEYGIRDIEHGTPDQVCDLVKPVGVVYTNISREHTQVAGIKNPFDNYFKAKQLLSQSMEDGVIISNTDDPNTTFISENNKNNRIIYYGLELKDYKDIFDEDNVQCPNCKNYLNYKINYFNQRGVYDCSCGFKRPEPNVKVVNYSQNASSCNVTINVNVYNYIQKHDVDFTLELTLPLIGIHNVYNILTVITVYSVFSPNKNIKTALEDFFRDYEFIVPPGRFEVLHQANKTIGVGQGDNGDALKVNSLLMKSYIEDEFELIYTTPDNKEEEIFEDHKLSIKALNPEKLVVIPGRVSFEASEEYYNELKEEFDTIYVPVEFDFTQRINKIIDLIKNSEYDTIMISGCGEEIYFWDELKKAIKKEIN